MRTVREYVIAAKGFESVLFGAHLPWAAVKKKKRAGRYPRNRLYVTSCDWFQYEIIHLSKDIFSTSEEDMKELADGEKNGQT